MPAAGMPEAEVDVTTDLVRSLLNEQHPDLAGLDLAPLTHGWDNAMFRLGPDLTVRLPRRQMAAQLVDHERRWLPVLASHLPVPVPTPVRVGRPSGDYPWTWTIVPWFDGEPIGAGPVVDPKGLAIELGAFVAAFHRPAPSDAPANPYPGVPLAERDTATRERIDRLGPVIDVARVAAAWEEALSAARWTGPPTWIHGDLHPLNLIARDGRLAAVIDFGDVTSGDPATDLLVAWSLFEPDDRERFRAAAQTDQRPIGDAMWARGRGWAIAHSLAILASSADEPAYEAIGRRTLDRACAS